jgi:uncharacterized protein (TIGR02246 family)
MVNSRFQFGLVFVVFFGLFSGLNRVSAVNYPATSEKQRTQTATGSPDDAAIRQSAEAFENAFNAGDAKAVASKWAEDGDYVNQSGQSYEGRAKIQQEYEKFFAKYPGVQIRIEVDKIKMLSPGTAVAEGTSTLGSEEKPATVANHYLCIYVKKNGQWQIASTHDLRGVDNTNYGEMKDLEPLIGTWHYKNGSSLVEMSCLWIADKKFLERKFAVSENGTVTTSGTQIIGKNPLSQQITSWLFDSTGGHDLGMWTRQDKGWIIQSTGAIADGTPTSSLNQLTSVDADTIAWKSVNRRAGDQQLPDSAEVLLKRVSANQSGK